MNTIGTLGEINDYYHHVNKKWLTDTIIPEDQVKWSEFNILQEENNKKVINLIKESSNDNIRKLYDSVINYFNKDNNIDKDNYIFKIIKNIDDIKNKNDLFIYIARLNFFGINFVYDINIDEDILDSNKYFVYLNQSGLGLPDKEYYISDKYKEIRIKYVDYLTKSCKYIFKDNKCNEYAQIILGIETDIAKIQLDKSDLRDIEERNNRYKLDDINNKYDNLFIKDYINEIIDMINYKYKNIESKKNFNYFTLEQFNLLNLDSKLDDENSYLYKLNNYINDISLEELKILLRYYVLSSYSSYICLDLYKLNFKFYNETLRGQKKMKPIEKRAMSIVCGIYGDLVTIDYAKHYYNQDIENYMLNMITNVKKLLNKRINNLDWMSKETKNKAIIKLNSMKSKIGYSKKVRDYSDLKMCDNVLNNIIYISIYETIDTLNKLNKTVDKDEWSMDGYIVNAYYSPVKNEIAFPAGILQPPFLDINESLEYNWGRIGVIIGHEIIHGFDDQGRLFDEDGNMKTWWTDKDSKLYKKKVKKVIKLYNNHGVNGKLTAGENIADIGGVRLSLDCLYDIKNRKLYDNELEIFFKSFAENWRAKMTEEVLKEKLLTDPHSPPWYRVNLCLLNIDEYYKIYNIKKELYIPKEKRINIW
jgi:putative endopeptidase